MVTVRDPDTELDPSVAVMEAVWARVEVDVAAVKAAEVAPEAMVTDAGTVTPVAVVPRVTTEPPAGAAEVMVTVQEDEAPAATLAGLHTRLDNEIDPVESVSMAVLVTAFATALIAAFCAGAVLTVVAVNGADVAFAGTITEAGTVTPVADVDTATDNPLPAAAALSHTVQVAEEPTVTLVGLHVRLESVAAVRAILAVLDDPFRVAVTVAV